MLRIAHSSVLLYYLLLLYRQSKNIIHMTYLSCRCKYPLHTGHKSCIHIIKTRASLHIVEILLRALHCVYYCILEKLFVFIHFFFLLKLFLSLLMLKMSLYTFIIGIFNSNIIELTGIQTVCLQTFFVINFIEKIYM